MKTKLFLVMFFCICSFLIINQKLFSQNPDACKAYLQNDTLILETGKVFEKFKWNNGNLIRIGFGLQSTGKSIVAAARKPVFAIRQSGTKNELIVTKQAESPKKMAFLKAEVVCKDGDLEIKRVFHLYPDCPAIKCDLFFRGDTTGSSLFATKGNEIASNSFALNGVHWYGKAIEFFDVTDRNNTLVREYNLLSYTPPKFNYPGIKHEYQLRGNLLFLENRETEERMFILKEAPCSSVQINHPGYDFTLLKNSEAKVMGLGLTPADINDSTWVMGYGSVVGMSESDDELGVLTALRDYQKTIRIMKPGRDEMIMLNTWGDMSSDAKINHDFAMAELEAGAKLGVTHFQLDGGWSAGKVGNSVVDPTGNFDNIWSDPNYWEPHPERFPNGLGPVVEKGKELGIEIGLWFNPDRTHSNANWGKDANAIIKLYRNYGIRTFKIDGVDLPDKLAEINFRKFLDRVSEATNYNVVFNLDVTASRRGGYHYFNEYGNLFVENRFTDWHDYFPYTTLRNVWMLSKYVPTQNLQIEFLNNTRNAEKYAGDPFAPANYSFDYVFAISMVAQPLAWFEASNLPTDAMEKGQEIIRKYRSIMTDFHDGNIFPIGNEPSGRSWTGFQSIQQEYGYFVIFREINNEAKATLKTWLKQGDKVSLEPIAGKGKAFTTKVGNDGQITFELPEKNSYALYKYVLK